jgi:hypothetical protein
MRKIFTLTAFMAVAISMNAQTRTGRKLYWKPTTASNSFTISAASGLTTGANYRFTDSTQWFYLSGPTTYTAISAFTGTGATTADMNILETDTLVINGHRLDINATMTIPTKVKHIILGNPQTGTGTQTLALQNGVTLTFANTASALGVNATGVLRLRTATNATTPTRLFLGTVLKATNTSTTVDQSQTGAQLSGTSTLALASRIGVTARASQATVATAATPFAGFSTFGSLPIVLMAFDAVKQATGVSIRWSTQQEFNTQDFYVERSTNGADYSRIGIVAAAGNSTTVSTYSYTDATPVTGIVYYRIRVIDLDGKEGITSIKALRASSSSVKVGIYPNPATTHANVLVNAEPNNPFTVAVYNQQGMLVGSQAPNSGNAVQLDLSRYTSGQYMVEVRFADGSRQTEKIIVAKN